MESALSLRTDRLSVLLSTYPGGYRSEPHEHENAYLSFVVAGGHAELTAGCIFDMAPGAFTLHPVGDAHRNVLYNAGLCELSVLIRPGFALVGSRRVDMQSKALLDISAGIQREVRAPVLDSPAVVEELAMAAICCASRAYDDRPSERWVASLDESLREGSEPLVDLGYHPAHVVKAYRRRYGQTPAEAHRAYRIERAKRLVGGGEIPLGEISVECGFADPSHFGRWFRRFTGITPREYRRWYGEKVRDSF